MAASKEEPKKRVRGRPATTPEDRENEVVAKAVILAEAQIEAGTASAQVISHYLKLGSTREKLEHKKMESELELLRAKVDEIDDRKKGNAMYEEALEAFKAYSGQDQQDYSDYVR